uniref:Xaa-Pro dipeptidyl-peptidase C-terminal domain-containing protein n=1 Tax=Bionectria ochroleuca TaxID=29856 RepID=A0A8H7N1P9_BIOOC
MSEAANFSTVEAESRPFLFEKNVSIKTKAGGMIRCNVFRPKVDNLEAKYPVLATIGPYGKDVHYGNFNPHSYSELPAAHKTSHSVWETPTPSHWTARGYVVVRADEPGAGQSPGHLDILSRGTIDAFVDLIEWAAEQPWSNGKVGLLGISYYGVTQWHVAARQPKGLAAIVPWEAASDVYRDACRHGGILSNSGMDLIWDRQIGPSQYGLPGKEARGWGDDPIDGLLSDEELSRNSTRLTDFARVNRFADGERFAAVNLNLEDIKVPVLSVANWGGLLLHLRGNVQGFMHSTSELKYLRFIVKVQESFLDAFLKDDDREGWKVKGKLPPVDLIIRKGNVGYNDPKAESQFQRRKENEWPIARTQYREMFLSSDNLLQWAEPDDSAPHKLTYQAFAEQSEHEFASFTSAPLEEETEITGHIVVHLNVSLSPAISSPTPSDIDLFLSLRHLDAPGNEVSYTGTTGEAAPISKGFLRISLRKTNPEHRRHRSWLPYREYAASSVLPVIPNEVYGVDVEIWPTNVVLQKGERLVLDIGSRDLAGTGFFTHNDIKDRSETIFKGSNHIHFGGEYKNYIVLPIIPEKK